jgi:hypothetical protein
VACRQQQQQQSLYATSWVMWMITMDDETKVGKFTVFPTDLLGNWQKPGKNNDGRYPDPPYFYANFNVYLHGQSSR